MDQVGSERDGDTNMKQSNGKQIRAKCVTSACGRRKQRKKGGEEERGGRERMNRPWKGEKKKRKKMGNGVCFCRHTPEVGVQKPEIEEEEPAIRDDDEDDDHDEDADDDEW